MANRAPKHALKVTVAAGCPSAPIAVVRRTQINATTTMNPFLVVGDKLGKPALVVLLAGVVLEGEEFMAGFDNVPTILSNISVLYHVSCSCIRLDRWPATSYSPPPGGTRILP